ncbi:uncharacterized protein LOC112251450 isoform X4 [Oncorhynchus tshawytscha]|uniref:uncharacterized protein LOC112251450 isoform X4 n=1 Tax=Oncorhynchus tshawytscha TaxID=74940 RepID=UPI001C3C62CF|nr:uncharacterized protein LOC112251450 isoform X4 [Oncorhynchus tshawytscha]
MEYLQSYHCLLCYLLLALRDPALCAKEITVSPAKPLVKVGDAVTLICETTCSQGKPHWMKLDESDVTQNTTKNRSYLHIAAVHPNHEGKYTCTAEKCRKQKKETIQLRVYSFPVPVLSTVPENPVSGQPFKVKCTLTNVYHGDYDTVEMLLLHLERLETEHSKNSLLKRLVLPYISRVMLVMTIMIPEALPCLLNRWKHKRQNLSVRKAKVKVMLVMTIMIPEALPCLLNRWKHKRQNLSVRKAKVKVMLVMTIMIPEALPCLLNRWKHKRQNLSVRKAKVKWRPPAPPPRPWLHWAP